MIETKEQVLTRFQETARDFLADPGLVSGIDFDDATVTLKRYVLSVMHDVPLGSRLAALPRLIRELDVTTLQREVAEIETALAD
jgi:hypothetical protein